MQRVGNPNYPGLAVARSIGDEWTKRLGVVDTPEFHEHSIGPKDLFAVWGSDGLYEWLTNAKIARIIYREALLNGWQAAAEKAVEVSRDLWTKHTKGSYIDDITCVIVVFRKLPRSL